MYKRPIPRPRGATRTQFVSTAQPGGGVISQWVACTQRVPIASGTPGRVGEIVDKMRNPTARAPRPRTWTPPQDYEFIAVHMAPREREAWLKTCREWFEARPKADVAPSVRTAGPIDHELIAAMYSRRQELPTLKERVKVYRAAGCSEEFVTKVIARDARLKETYEERTRTLDEIFAKWPAASKTAGKAKPKPKVIKAVKKKL